MRSELVFNKDREPGVGSDEVVRVEDLCKRVSPTFRLEGVSFCLERGRGLALVGGNGAGKSTLLRLLAGLSKPDSGKIIICGEQFGPWSHGSRRVSLVQQLKSLPEELTVKDYVRHQLRLRRANVDAYADLLRLSHLERFEQTRLTRLSGGNQRKVHLLCAVAHAPDLVLLDEPTSGLDAEARESLLNLIRHLKQRGMSVVVATHHMDELRGLADDVLVLHDGRPGDTTSMADLGGHVSGHCLEVELRDQELGAARLEAALAGRREGLEFVSHIELGNFGARLFCADDDTHLPRTAAWLSERGFRVSAIRRYEPSLAEVIGRVSGNGHEVNNGHATKEKHT
jgi:ABC-2 type transport system ATP-binding protein